ncbi:MAG: hypothetical protein ACT443_03780 [Gemmatimonadota bacterium]
MRRSIAAVLFVVSLCIPITAIAQDAPPPYLGVTAFEVPVAESMRWEEAVRQIVDAAGKAKLEPAFGWSVWQNANTYAVIAEMQKIGELDDPMMWMREFENTPGHAVLMQAFQKFNGMHFREESEVMQPVKEWSYFPAGVIQPPMAFAEVIEYWTIGGSDEQFDALAREGIAVLKAANYPFAVLGHRTPVGERRAQFVVLYDDAGRHATADAALDRNAQWQALGARVMPLLVDMQTAIWRYRAELSYLPQP